MIENIHTFREEEQQAKVEWTGHVCGEGGRNTPKDPYPANSSFLAHKSLANKILFTNTFHERLKKRDGLMSKSTFQELLALRFSSPVKTTVVDF